MLQVKNLRKTFGSLTAVSDISFDIPQGHILGMIGQNGAGKTTTFRLILNFLTPDAGQVLWKGRGLNQEDYEGIGYLPEERGLYPKLTIEEQILYFAKLRGMDKKDILSKVDYWMDKFEVKGKKTDKIQSLSKGNQQKVQLITTLIHQPKLVILDEPFSGLDPVNAGLLKNAIFELKEQGACVIFSSHNMDNVEELCDSLVMIRNGQQVLSGTVNEIRQSFGRLNLFLDQSISRQQIETLPGVLSYKALNNGQWLLKLANQEAGQAIFQEVTRDGYLPVFNQQPPTLEEIFKMKAGEGHE